jgi:hypothetical protein
MQHLPIERLAELGSSEPTAAEVEHLATCTMCASEHAAYERVVAMAADERRRIAPPLTDWGSLRSQLRSQGMIMTPAEAEAGRAWSAKVSRVSGRIAALAVSGGSDVAVSTLDTDDFTSTASALQVLRRAQEEYERAAVYLASHDTSASEGASDLLRTRLAALDEMAETSLRALGNAPADPIMNQVYLTTLGARNMTLGRLATALPVGSRLSRF